MEKPEIPELKITSRQNCNFILNFYRSLTSEEYAKPRRNDMEI